MASVSDTITTVQVWQPKQQKCVAISYYWIMQKNLSHVILGLSVKKHFLWGCSAPIAWCTWANAPRLPQLCYRNMTMTLSVIYNILQPLNFSSDLPLSAWFWQRQHNNYYSGMKIPLNFYLKS